jgi:predicted dehydrogenase
VVSMPESGRIRAGVVGAGHMGQYHILALAELWDVDLVAICDTDAERARQIAAEYGTQAVATHQELAGLVDIATVAVPTERHFEVARDLLEAGVHVLVEKPVTPTLEEAKELFRLARQRGRVLHVGHVERFNGAVQELRKIVERPVLIESRRLGPFVPRVQNDSVVMDLMIHDIDIVLGLVDSEPRRMNALGRSILSRQADVANVQILFDSGAMATITASRATEEKIRTLSITQPDAYIVLNYADQDIQIHRRAAQEYTLNRESIRYRQASFVERLFVHKDNPLKLEIRHLISAARAVKATGQVELPETEDLRSLAVALEIERMIREGRGEVAWPKDLPWSAASR